jgi:hypothetical protein
MELFGKTGLLTAPNLSFGGALKAYRRPRKTSEAAYNVKKRIVAQRPDCEVTFNQKGIWTSHDDTIEETPHHQRQWCG